MNREEAKEHILRNPEPFLQKAKRSGYICPLCENGTGADGDGLLLDKRDKTGTHYKCFKCGFYGDTLEMIAQLHMIEDPRDIFLKAYEIYGLTVDGQGQNQAKNERYTHAPTHTHIHSETPTDKAMQSAPAPQTDPPTNYREFFLKAKESLPQTDYLLQRGISLEVQRRFMVGYVPDWRSPKALRDGKNPPASPRIIIPTSQYSYVARDTRPDSELEESQKKYKKMKEGAVSIFNLKALKEGGPIFILEGEIDAMSVIEVGGQAIGLGGTAGGRAFIEALKKAVAGDKKAFTDTVFILSLDNDEPGRKASILLETELGRLGCSYTVENIAGGCKDANEALASDREGFTRVVDDAQGRAKSKDQIERENYLRGTALHYLEVFLKEVGKAADTPAIATGYKELDTLLDGGLYEGLYIIGAIPSLGKTTFTLQLADQVAASGHDVLIFSLEMAKTELIAKSISRETFLYCSDNKIHHGSAKTARGITAGQRYASYGERDMEVIEQAHMRYSRYAGKIRIIEGMGDVGVKEIREAVEKHTYYTGQAPLVVVDFLQILAPYNERATDKQNTDKAVLELKRISRDYKLPLIAISSLNRGGYSEPVIMESFKESGGIEYSCDVLMGLQMKGVGKNGYNPDEAKKKNPREIELRILKNRNGGLGTSEYSFYSFFNYFEEAVDVF